MSDKKIPSYRILALAVQEELVKNYYGSLSGKITNTSYGHAWKSINIDRPPNDFRTFDRHRKGHIEPNPSTIDVYLNVLECTNLAEFEQSNWYYYIIGKYFKQESWLIYFSFLKSHFSNYYINDTSFNRIGFLSDDSGINSLGMEELYVDLCYIPKEELKKQSMLLLKEKQSSFQKILYQRTQNHQYISEEIILQQGIKRMVLGNPGVGKSTYAKWLCFNWAKSPTNELTVPIYINLPDLTFTENQYNLIAYCLKTYFKKLPITEKELLNLLDKYHFLLDGFDELKDSYKIELIKELRKINLETFTLFTRPYGVINQNIPVDNSYEILGFNEGTRLNYLEKVFKNNNKSELLEELRELINENPTIDEISFNPLLLSQLAAYSLIIGSPKKEIANISNTYQFIDKILSWIKVRYIQKGQTESDFIKRLDGSLEFAYMMETDQLTIYQSETGTDKYGKVVNNLSRIGLGRKESMEIGQTKFYYFSLVYQEFLAAKFIRDRLSSKAILYLINFPYFWNFIRYIIGSCNSDKQQNELFSELVSHLNGDEDYTRFTVLLSEFSGEYINTNLSSENDIDYLFDGYLKYGDTEWQLIIENSIQKIFIKYSALSQNYLINKIFEFWKTATLNSNPHYVTKTYFSVRNLVEKLRLYKLVFFLDPLISFMEWGIKEYNARIGYVEKYLESDENIDEFTSLDESRDPIVREHGNIGEVLFLAFDWINRMDESILQHRKNELLSIIDKTSFDIGVELTNLKHLLAAEQISFDSIYDELNQLLEREVDTEILERFSQKLFIFTNDIIQNEQTNNTYYSFIKDVYTKLEKEIIENEEINKSTVYNWVIKALNNIQSLQSLTLRIEMSTKYLLNVPIYIQNQDDLIEILDNLIKELKRKWDFVTFTRIVQIVLYSNWRASIYVRYRDDLFSLLKESILQNAIVLNFFNDSMDRNEPIKPDTTGLEIKSVIERYKIGFLDSKLKYDLNDCCKRILRDKELMEIKYVRCFYILSFLDNTSHFDQFYWDYLKNVILDDKSFVIAFRLLKNPDLYTLNINVQNAIQIWDIVLSNIEINSFEDEEIFRVFYPACYEFLSVLYTNDFQNDAYEVVIKLSKILMTPSLLKDFFSFQWLDYDDESVFWIYPLIYLYTFDSKFLENYKNKSFKNLPEELEVIIEKGITLFNQKELLHLEKFFHKNVSAYLNSQLTKLSVENQFSVEKLNQLLN